ncbi:MAG: PAS domain S-box protein [Acidobacteriota bacterium]
MSDEARFRALVEHSSDLLCVVAQNGTLVYVNPSVELLLGRLREDLVGSDLFSLIHPEDHELLRATLVDPRRVPTELRVETQSGLKVLETAASLPAADFGIEGILLDARDVTERRIAQDALLESEGKFRRLFEESRDAILIGTNSGSVLDVNPAGVRLFGYDSKEQMLELDIARDLYWNPKDRKRSEALFMEQGFLEEEELELKTRDGRRLRIKETASAVHDSRGEIVGFRGILRDVTEQRQLQEQLRQSQKMEAVGRLAGGVAHDFNNLLTAINGYSELALARMAEDDSQRGALEEIRKAGKRATDLTRRLLTLSRHQVVSPRRISLNRAVLDMEKLLQRVIGEDIELRTGLDPELPAIYADQGQIEQIILNLAVNARDAMPDGGSLRLGTRRARMPSDDPSLPRTPVPGDYVILKVEDTGTGMEKKVREHLFEPFFTTKGRGHNTGLGLAIVYGIIKQSGGFIEVESAEGEGSVFHLFFPIHVPPKPKIPESSAAHGQPVPRGSERVLLVEDETSVRTLVRQILELQGYRVMAARNARAAIALCDEQESSPDLLLTDVVMPGRSGLALAEDLKQRFSDLKILFMSGYTDSHTGVKLLTQQKAAFLPKPFSPEALARKVREVLDD